MMLHLVAVLTALAIALPPASGRADDGHAARMRREHEGETPSPSPATRPDPARPVTGRAVAYATLGGRAVRGYLARPEAAGTLPGLIVIHEWWGLNDNVRAMTRRLAGEGYVALAVDLYQGRVATTAAEAGAAMQVAMADPARLEDNLRQAHAYLRDTMRTERIGVIGWCFGGGWSLRTALDRGDEIAAAVVYYGRPVTAADELGRLRAPILGLYGALDRSIPLEQVRTMQRELARLGRDATIVVYDDADHAFANPSGPRYQAAAATDAWRRTTAFLARTLQPLTARP